MRFVFPTNKYLICSRGIVAICLFCLSNHKISLVSSKSAVNPRTCVISKLVFCWEIFSLTFLITPFHPSRVAELWFFPSHLFRGTSLRFRNTTSLGTKQSILLQLCRTSKTILANSPLFLPTLALPELPPKFYSIPQTAFHRFLSTMMMIWTVFVITVPFPSCYTDRAAKAKTVFTPVMRMGQTARASWAIGTHTSMLLHSIPLSTIFLPLGLFC